MKTMWTMLALLTLGLTVMTGCGAGAKPEGFPDTVPFTLTVTKGGAPLVGAKVMLYSDTGTDVSVGGNTNEQGVVSLITVRGSYQKPGAPEGTFKVTVNKEVAVQGEMSEEEFYKLGPAEAAEYTKKMEEKKKSLPPAVPVQYTSVSKTTLSVTVSANGSAAVKVD